MQLTGRLLAGYQVLVPTSTSWTAPKHHACILTAHPKRVLLHHIHLGRAGVMEEYIAQVTLRIRMFNSYLIRQLDSDPILLRVFELAIVQLGIEPVARQQLLVLALLHDVALIHHQDQVRVADGG